MSVKKPIIFEDVEQSPLIVSLLKRANEQMRLLNFTEHGERHAHLVGNTAQKILLELGFGERIAELAVIAGYLHDIGNVIHRDNHANAGALIAMDVLQRLGMDFDEVSLVMGAIGNHEEERGDPVGEIAAAVIIADKSDVHRSRVQEADHSEFDIHDRVNYSTQQSSVYINSKKKTISLRIEIDTKISQIMEYFEIFLERMLMVRRAADFLGCKFRLYINKTKLF